jgi:hypothetical protein
MKDVVTATANTAKQIKLIQRANREHSTVSHSIVERVGEIRRITQQNAAGVEESRGSTTHLLLQARALGDAVAAVKRPRSGLHAGNGNGASRASHNGSGKSRASKAGGRTSKKGGRAKSNGSR